MHIFSHQAKERLPSIIHSFIHPSIIHTRCFPSIFLSIPSFTMPDTLPPRTPSSQLAELRQEMTRQNSQQQMSMAQTQQQPQNPIRTRRSQKSTTRRMSADGGVVRDPYTMALSATNTANTNNLMDTTKTNNSHAHRATSSRRRRMSNEFSKNNTNPPEDVATPLPSLYGRSGNHKMVQPASSKTTGRTVRAASRRRRSLEHESSSSSWNTTITGNKTTNNNNNPSPHVPPSRSTNTTSSTARPTSTRRGMRSNVRGTRRASLDSGGVEASRFQF